MSSLFDEHYSLNSHVLADTDVTGHPCMWFGDDALRCQAVASQIAPDTYCSIWAPHENALYHSDTQGVESNLVVDLFSRALRTSTSNQADIEIFNTSPSRQPSRSDNGAIWQPIALHHQSISKEATFLGDWEDYAPQVINPMILSECRPTRKPTARSPGKCSTASRLSQQSTNPRSLRYIPYPVGSNSVAFDSSYQCRWSDSAGPCGAVVLGSKNAIGKHLQDAHAVQLRADKTPQVCRWEKCRKSMRKESIARHILAVHMQDKVPCPSCGTRFARTDSLQRHQRMQCRVKREAPVADCGGGVE